MRPAVSGCSCRALPARRAGGRGRAAVRPLHRRATAAMSMIRNREIWLRNTQCMNDFSEVLHRFELLREAYRSAGGCSTSSTTFYPGLRVEAVDLRFEAIAADDLGSSTYITCLSEHDPAPRTSLGRLSMWRAYSQVCGVAFVFNAPAAAGDAASHDGRRQRRAGGVRRSQDVSPGASTRSSNADGRRAATTSPASGRRPPPATSPVSYYFAALSTKHPGFSEEREWRVVFHLDARPAGHLVRSVEICPNEPQVVYKLPLRNAAEAGADDGMALADILEALIIGPSDNPPARCATPSSSCCSDAGVSDAERRVPEVRHSGALSGRALVSPPVRRLQVVDAAALGRIRRWGDAARQPLESTERDQRQHDGGEKRGGIDREGHVGAARFEDHYQRLERRGDHDDGDELGQRAARLHRRAQLLVAQDLFLGDELRGLDNREADDGQADAVEEPDHVPMHTATITSQAAPSSSSTAISSNRHVATAK